MSISSRDRFTTLHGAPPYWKWKAYPRAELSILRVVVLSYFVTLDSYARYVFFSPPLHQIETGKRFWCIKEYIYVHALYFFFICLRRAVHFADWLFPTLFRSLLMVIAPFKRWKLFFISPRATFVIIDRSLRFYPVFQNKKECCGEIDDSFFCLPNF